MSFELRRWQAEALPVVMQAITERRKGVVSAVMGAGKSVFLREVARRWLEAGGADHGPVVVTTPTVKLVEQLAGTLSQLGIPVGRYYTHAKEANRRVIVTCNSSAASLAREWDGKRVAGLWIADEAHKSEADDMHEAAEALRPVARLAVTATPFRSQSSERISLFDEVLYTYTPADALRDGVIVPWRIYGWEGEDATIDDACAELIRKHGEGPGIVNASTIADAVAYSERLTRDGVPAAAIHSRTGQGEQDRLLRALRAGELRALVHVNLLSEGVDLPWLRWLCLRRQVGARVRFVQEVGRVLRSCPGKTHATLLDPHDLFGTFGLAYEAALGWYEEQVASGEIEDAREEANGGEGPDPAARRAKRVQRVAAWARQLLLAMQADGIVKEGNVQGSGWRQLPPSPKQLETLRKMAFTRRWLPELHGVALKAVAHGPEGLTRGVVSDLLSIEFALVERKSGWVPEVEVPAPDLATIMAEAVADPGPWRCATVLADGAAALVVLQGERIVYARAREAVSGDTWGAVASKGEAHARRLADGAPVQVGDAMAKQLAYAEARKLSRRLAPGGAK